MKNGFLGSLLALPAVVGMALADPCACAPAGCCVPTTTLNPVTLYRQPPPPWPEIAPTQPIPPPTLFRREVTPPVYSVAPPPPPVCLFTMRPPPIETFNGAPPPVELFRKEAPPPLWTEVPPPCPVTLFRRVPTPTQFAPPESLPPITIVSQPLPSSCGVGCAPVCVANPGTPRPHCIAPQLPSTAALNPPLGTLP
jgi:hypothetical protein